MLRGRLTKAGVGLLAVILGTEWLSAGVLFRDGFNYPDGPLTEVASGIWMHHSGTAGDAAVRTGQLCLSQAKTEHVSALLAGQPLSSKGTNVLYARLAVNFNALPSGPDGAYFAHFKNGGTGYRARLFATTNNAAPGCLRLGLANASNAASVFWPADLLLNTRHVVVVGLVVSNGLSRLWVDPSSESDTSVSASDNSSPISVVAFAFRQSLSGGNGMGTLTVDDLVVADSFTDATAAGLPAGAPPVVRFTHCLGNLVRAGDLPTNSFTELVLQPGERVSSTVLVTDPSGRPLVIATPPEALPPTARWSFGATNDPSIQSAVFSWEAGVADAGKQYAVQLRASNGTAETVSGWSLYVPTTAEQSLVLNEFLANPTTDTAAPHFNPLRRDLPSPDPSVADEYLEFVNRSDTELNLAGWTIGDAVQVRHRFSEPFVLPGASALIVYGGPLSGYPPHLAVRAVPANGGAAGLALNNSGTETIVLRNHAGNLVMRVVYTEAMLSAHGSLTRFPDFNGPFVAEDQISVLPVSPGLQFDGRPFNGLSPARQSVRTVSISRLNDGLMRLAWTAEAAYTYTVWQSDSLAAPFQELYRGLRFATGGVGEFIDVRATNSPQRFYWISTP